MNNLFKYDKFNESLNKKDIDPFDEEDWDEIDGHYTIFKLWVGATSKEIRMLCFPAHIQISDGLIYIRDDRYRIIHKDKDYRFDDKVSIGIYANNCFIIDELEYDINNIFLNFKSYIDSKERGTISNISKFKKMLSGDYERDEDDEDINEDDIQERLRMEKILLQNIKEFKPTIETEIKKLVKINQI